MANRILLTGCAALAAALAFAAGEKAEDESIFKPAETNGADQAKAFTSLPLCRRVEGLASVKSPKGDWEEAEEGRFYPFGTSFRAEKGGILSVGFGSGSTVTVADGSEFATRPQPIGTPSRTVVIVRGAYDLKLPDNLPEGLFFVTAPGFTVKNLAGESRIVYEDMGDGDKATIRCVTGTLGVEGRHFDIPVMRSANELDIRTSRDHLFTSLYGNSGDFVVNVNQGIRYKEEFAEDGTVTNVIEKGNLEWHMTPRTKIVINRSVPAIGERMSVHSMAFDAAGERKSECSFCEGRAEINSGELVARGKLSAEEVARRAEAATAEKPKEKADEGKDAEEKADEGKDAGEKKSDSASDEE